MDTRIIDVAIGLALIFALTSLLAAAVQEVYSSWKGLRGKVLHQAIVSFVGDDPEFAQALLDHPLLVSLSPQQQQQRGLRRPSYVAADSVVSALIGHLVQTQAGGVRPDTPLQLVDAVQGVASGAISRASALLPAQTGSLLAGATATAPNALFARGLAALVIGVERDWPAFEARVAAWYDSVGARSSGWFKRKTQVGVFVIGLVTAALVNINPLVIGSRLWEDEALRKAVVAAATSASEKYAAQKQGATMTSPATAPAASAAASGASGAADAGTPAAARVVAPPARATVGAGAPAPAVTAALPAAAQAVTDAHASYLKTLDSAVLAAQRDVVALRVLLPAASAALAFEPPLLAWQAAGAPPDGPALQALRAAAQALLDSAAAATARAGAVPASAAAAAAAAVTSAAPAPLLDGAQQVARAVGRAGAPRVAPPVAAQASAAALGLPDAQASTIPGAAECRKPGMQGAVRDLCEQLKELSSLQQSGVPIGWSRSALPDFFENGCVADGACADFAWVGKSGFWGNLLLMLAGWLVTGLACTLGAPFWFDALSKLVRLRGSGGKPDNAAGGATATPTMLTPSAAANAPLNAASAPAAMSDALNDAERALSVAEVQRLQRGLPLPEVEVTGFFDGNTRRAIQAWQERRGLLPASGELTAAQITELLAMRSGAGAPGAPAGAAAGAGTAAPGHSADEHLDGCDVDIVDLTDDEQLPGARGGVAGDQGD